MIWCRRTVVVVYAAQIVAEDFHESVCPSIVTCSRILFSFHSSARRLKSPTKKIPDLASGV